MDIELDKLLSRDPLSEAEKITGKRWDESMATSFLGMAMHLSHTEKVSAALKSANDTSFSRSLQENLSVFESIGLNLVLQGDIPDSEDKWRIYWGNGVLLFCDSYFKDTSLNGGSAYYNYKGPREAIRHGSNGCVAEIGGEIIWGGNFDVREGLRHNLSLPQESGEILKQWAAPPFMWLLHYQDSKIPGYDYRKINSDRISLLPKEVRKAICFE